MGRNRILGSPYEQQVIHGGNVQTEPSTDRYLIDNTSGAKWFIRACGERPVQKTRGSAALMDRSSSISSALAPRF
jgi:hypothetical protein